MARVVGSISSCFTQQTHTLGSTTHLSALKNASQVHNGSYMIWASAVREAEQELFVAEGAERPKVLASSVYVDEALLTTYWDFIYNHFAKT